MIVTLLDIILLISLELTVVSKSDLESENLGYIHPACSDRNVYFKNIDSGRRIIGGSDACIKDYPFAVSMQTKRRDQKCGGSLIKPEWILTAAHCLLFTQDLSLPLRPVNDYVLIMGSEDTRKNMESSKCQIRMPKKFIPHNKFDHQYMRNDVGLILVAKAFLINAYVNVAPLPSSQNLKVDTLCTVVGWGYTADPGINGENADLDLLAVNLKEVDVPIIGTVTCQHYYESDTVVETNICAGYDIGEKDACGGDSGGPLICNGILMGLVSWGYRCAFPESPGVYTRVKSYLQWINKTVMGKHSSWHYLIPASSGQISGHLCVSSTCANKTHSESTPAT